MVVKWGVPSLDASFRTRARDGAESNQWSEFCSMLDSVTLSSSPDRIFCDLNGEGEFRVKDIHSSIDDTFLPSSDSATRWVKTVPIKVNILAWRTRLDRLPTRVNLIMREVNIDSSLCPVCSSVQEDSNDLFFLCDLGEVDEPMVDPEVNEEVMDDDDWDVEVEWLMAPVTPLRDTITVPSTYKVGGPSTAAIEGPSFPLRAPGLPVPPTVIEDLGTRLGNLEYKHGVLTRKVEEVSDAEVADNIAIGEIHPRVATVGEQEGDGITDSASVSGQNVIVGSSKQVQTLQTALHEIALQNQQLRTRVAEMESHMGIVMPYMLWMEEHLTVLEKRLPGPPPGPQ
nr:RNA-directed DNA polymerase, eukaryota [Tanacetum cinerariifolium]